MQAKQFSAGEIAGFFLEWARLAGNTKPMPNERQCARVAEIMSPVGALDYFEIFNAIADGPGPSPRVYAARARQIVSDALVLKKSIRSLQSYRAKHAPSAPLPPDLAVLIRALDSVIEKRGLHRRAGGRPDKSDEDVVMWLVAEACRESLLAAGWRKNASPKSDDGPVAFVVGKIFALKPRTAAKRLRRMVQN